MQQVNQTGFRLGSATGWHVSRHEKTNVDLNWRYADATRKALAKRGLFCINNYMYNHRGVMVNVVVFYRYLQRSRLNRWLVQRLRRREGALAPWPARYRILYKLDVASLKSTFNRKVNLRQAFPLTIPPRLKRERVPFPIWKTMSAAQREAHNAKFDQAVPALIKNGLVVQESPRQKAMRIKLSKRLRGWVDLEWKLYNVYKLGETESLARQLRLIYDQLLNGRSEVLLYNVMQFVPMLNPLVAARYYIFKRFAGLLYQADLIQVTYLAIHFNMSRLLAHTIVLGLQRHAAKRQQRRFLKMVEATILRLTTWEALQLAPFICRISVYGKLDAKMRRTHVLLECGDTQYQQMNFLTSAHKQVSRTKFGTSTVQIW